MGVAWRDALAGAAVLFLAFLVLKLRPSGAGSWRLGLDGRVKEARLRADAATTPRGKAEALCEAGRYAHSARRYRLAAGFFLRAMNADPSWPDGVDATVSALTRRRPRLLERILWRQLSRLPWDSQHSASIAAAGRGLVQLYRYRVRDGAKAEFLRRFLADVAVQPAPKG